LDPGVQILGGRLRPQFVDRNRAQSVVVGVDQSEDRGGQDQNRHKGQQQTANSKNKHGIKPLEQNQSKRPCAALADFCGKFFKEISVFSPKRRPTHCQSPEI
jgi:hypothetical protein